MNILYACLSDIGKRDINQDYHQFYIDDHLACFVVADGCGAYEGSEFASKSLLENIILLIPEHKEALLAEPNKTFQMIVDEAAQVMVQTLEELGHHEAATTLAALLIFDQGILVAHVGDSRVVRYDGNNNQLWHTKDHTEFEILKDAGKVTDEDMHHHPAAHMLVNVFDDQMAHKLEMKRLGEFTTEQVFLLATDGVWPYLEKEDYQAMKNNKDAMQTLEDIIARIKKQNLDDDNMTAILVRRV